MDDSNLTRALTRNPPSAGCASFSVRVLHGNDTGLVSVFENPRAVVGRSEAADLRLTDPAVSLFHVELSSREIGIEVRDLGSRNGTILGEAFVERVVVPAQGQGSFRPIFATKFIFVPMPSDVSEMTLAELRSSWERALSHRGSCPKCGRGRISHNGTRTRKASILRDGHVEFVPEIPERRLFCRDCDARWTHPPEGISSRAHYQPCVVEHALATMGHEPLITAATIAREHGCHPRTLGRWIDRVADIADPRDLGAMVIAEADAPVLPAIATEVSRPGGAHAHKRLMRALAVLALLEALVSLRALEPPALAHAHELARPMPENAPGPKSRGEPRSLV